ncbi:hypothetical protein CYANOKiyG1_25060 [Okeania sp. KiyG1]|nr:hypothetical protein CYANOKiyG1_25060 [Okeania sp. KiyG1]
MGAIRYQGEKYFNYLLKDEKASRISRLSSAFKKVKFLNVIVKFIFSVLILGRKYLMT